MNWIKVVTGFVLMGAALVGWYRLMRHLKGDSGGSGMKLDVGSGRRGRGAASSELEQFVASHRLGGAVAPAETSDAPRALASAVAVALPAADPGIGAGPANPSTPPAVAVTTPPAAPVTPAAIPLLSGHARLAFLLFRTALPDHLVFPRVALGELVPDAGIARGHVFTLVVCRADLAVVAVADFRSADGIGPAVTATISRAGLRHVVLDPAQLPRRDAVRPLLGLD